MLDEANELYLQAMWQHRAVLLQWVGQRLLHYWLLTQKAPAQRRLAGASSMHRAVT
ncbi:hypothetical protein [Pseudomonas alabamensis]|jgi:hypothetical protein|uniref:hypothetical protein n=1 Tax=Pseudomonas alabamensis TaxID=3064349 RepID=UPI0016428BDC